MNHIFLITSGINVNFGLYSVEERIAQTIKTAISIKKYVANSRVILVEGGYTELSYTQRNLLLQYYDDIYDFSRHNAIYQIQRIGGILPTALKSACEPYLVKSALQIVGNQQNSRVYKLSGRYCITEEFSVDSHNQFGKLVFLEKEPGAILYEENSQWQFLNSEYQYQTVCYSICGSIVEEVVEYFENVYNTLMQLYSSGTFTIVEAAVYQLVPNHKIVEISKMGISGYASECGKEIKS